MSLPRYVHSSKTIQRFKHVPSKVAQGIAEHQAMDKKRRSLSNKNECHNSMPHSGAIESGACAPVGRDQSEADIQAEGDQQRRRPIGNVCGPSSMLEYLTPRERGRDFWVGEVHNLDESLAGSNGRSYDRLIIENDRLLKENERLRNEKVRLVADKLSAQEFINYLQAKLDENTIETMHMKRSLITIRQRMDTKRKHERDTPQPASVPKAQW
ncbi:protein swallow-like [Drosophila obscura]|uniref:protein swallow-like n=1 Tax=Drosophila obscura TaxID=7282 RepID=UPI001BB0E57C|nr:protein swallow-like [Drosophila obscura]